MLIKLRHPALQESGEDPGATGKFQICDEAQIKETADCFLQCLHAADEDRLLHNQVEENSSKAKSN